MGAEVESLRAELLNDPHTLLLLPCIRERLYMMNFTVIRLDACTQSFLRLPQEIGKSENNIFRVCDELLNVAQSLSLAHWKFLQRCVEDRTYYYLVGLDKLLAKLAINSNRYEIFRRVIILPAGCPKYIGHVIVQSFYDFVIKCLNSGTDCDRDESTSYAMVVAAVVVLLFCVCQYLVLFVDRGRGSRSYSSGSLDFRDVYISIVLFRGAYIWIKFRQAATSETSLKRKSYEAQHHVPGVYCKAVKNKSGTITHYKYEPRFKPRREKLNSGDTLQFSRLSLGEYDTPGEAKIVQLIAAFYYGGKDDAGDGVELEDGSFFDIPAMDEHEKRLTGLNKAKWVTERAKKLYKELQAESALKSRKQSRTSNAAVGLDVGEPVGSCHGAVLEPEFLGVQHNAPEMGKEAPEPHRHGNSSACDGDAPMSAYDQEMFDELRFGCANILSQAKFSGVDLVAGSVVLGDGSPRQPDNGAALAFDGIPNLNCAQGWESLGAVHDKCTVTKGCEPAEGDLHPLVSGLKDLLQEYATRVADLQHEQLKAGVMISELRRDIEQLRTGKLQADVMISGLQLEIELMRADDTAREASAAAKSQDGTWLADFVIDI